MRKFGLVLLLVFGALLFLFGPLSLVCRAADLQERVIDNSIQYLDLRERTNHNDDPTIDRMLAYLGLPPRLSWCAAFVIWNYKEAGCKLPRQGRCATLLRVCQANGIRYLVFDAEEVAMGIRRLQPGDMPIWAHGRINAARDFNGHTGIILGQRNRTSFISREGNTMPSNAGDQREGGGVYDRQRGLGFGSSFRVVGFIRVR